MKVSLSTVGAVAVWATVLFLGWVLSGIPLHPEDSIAFLKNFTIFPVLVLSWIWLYRVATLWLAERRAPRGVLGVLAVLGFIVLAAIALGSLALLRRQLDEAATVFLLLSIVCLGGQQRFVHSSRFETYLLLRVATFAGFAVLSNFLAFGQWSPPAVLLGVAVALGLLSRDVLKVLQRSSDQTSNASTATQRRTRLLRLTQALLFLPPLVFGFLSTTGIIKPLYVALFVPAALLQRPLTRVSLTATTTKIPAWVGDAYALLLLACLLLVRLT